MLSIYGGLVLVNKILSLEFHLGHIKTLVVLVTKEVVKSLKESRKYTVKGKFSIRKPNPIL